MGSKTTKTSRRKSETAQLRELFETLGIRERYNQSRARARGRNAFAKWMIEAYVATGEPVFIEAMCIANIYGFDACDDPMRRIRQIGSQLASVRAIAQVEAELRRH